MIEAQVHGSLKSFLKSQGRPPNPWNHHLTMGRLVARALRVGKSALINTGSFPSVHSWGYLTAALLGGGSCVLVIEEPWRSLLMTNHLPELQRFLGTSHCLECDRLPDSEPQGQPTIYFIAPALWLQSHSLEIPPSDRVPWPMPVLIEQADQLPDWVRQSLTRTIAPQHWRELKQWGSWELIETYQIKLTQEIFKRPSNPHQVYSFNEEIEALLTNLFNQLKYHSRPLPQPWNLFEQQWARSEQMNYLTIDREQGLFSLHSSPLRVEEELGQLLNHSSNVLVGNFGQKPYFHFDVELEHHTRVDFAPDHRCDPIQLYLPYSFPFPNTAEFAQHLITQLDQLLTVYDRHFVVLLIDDVPLKSKVGATLAGIFGSRVKIETTDIGRSGVLVAGWDFWTEHHSQFPIPQLLVISTLPLPSLEHPLVALRVEHHKQRKENWFKVYLLPAALRRMQQAIAPVRQHQGTIALLDTRVNARSYGPEVLQSLEPYTRISKIHRLDLWGN
jgi:ATP-dependent DNA helicase DinG